MGRNISIRELARGLTDEDAEIFLSRTRFFIPEIDNRDSFLMGAFAHEQATSEVPRAERMKAYAWIDVDADEQRKAEKGAVYVGTIDLTPAWSEAAEVLIAVLEDGNAEGKRLAREELRRMAKLLTALVAERGHDGPVREVCPVHGVPHLEPVEWTAPRYPGGDAENGPARRNPVNGCVECGDKDADSYSVSGVCDACEDFG